MRQDGKLSVVARTSLQPLARICNGNGRLAVTISGSAESKLTTEKDHTFAFAHGKVAPGSGRLSTHPLRLEPIAVLAWTWPAEDSCRLLGDWD